jgi:hypothetical protein
MTNHLAERRGGGGTSLTMNGNTFHIFITIA